MPLRCIHCDEAISAERQIHFLSCRGSLPEECEKCSTEVRNSAFQVFPHKTGGDAVVINANGAGGSERLRQAIRANDRSR